MHYHHYHYHHYHHHYHHHSERKLGRGSGERSVPDAELELGSARWWGVGLWKEEEV